MRVPVGLALFIVGLATFLILATSDTQSPALIFTALATMLGGRTLMWPPPPPRRPPTRDLRDVYPPA